LLIFLNFFSFSLSILFSATSQNHITMYNLFHLSAALALASYAFGLPQDHNHDASSVAGAGKETCTPNAFEKNNLAHHHDINTGEVILGETVINVGELPGGTGCSPLWAGGSYDDRATYPGGKYPTFVQGLADKKGKMATKVKRHGPDGDEEVMPSPSAPPAPPSPSAPKTPTPSPKAPVVKRHGPDGDDEAMPTSKTPTTPIPTPPAPKGPTASEAAEWADTIHGVLQLGKGKPAQ
jgi:hypothetical protein